MFFPHVSPSHGPPNSNLPEGPYFEIMLSWWLPPVWLYLSPCMSSYAFHVYAPPPFHSRHIFPLTSVRPEARRWHRRGENLRNHLMKVCLVPMMISRFNHDGASDLWVNNDCPNCLRNRWRRSATRHWNMCPIWQDIIWATAILCRNLFLFVRRGILSYCGGQDSGGDSISQLFLRIRTSCCLPKNIFYKCSYSTFKCNLFRNGCFVCICSTHKVFWRLISATKNFKVQTLIRELVLCVYFLPSIRRSGA